MKGILGETRPVGGLCSCSHGMQRDAFTDTENVDQAEPCDAFTNPGGWRSQQRSADPESEVLGQRGTDLKCHLSPDPSFALALASNGLWPRQWEVPGILWSHRSDDPESGSVMGGMEGWEKGGGCVGG